MRSRPFALLIFTLQFAVCFLQFAVPCASAVRYLKANTDTT